jgi:hypothetical protein
MRAFVFVACIALPGLFTHLALFGWRRAPRDVVHLNPRQWWRVALIAAPFITTILLVISTRRTLFFPPDSDWPGALLLSCFVGLGSIAYGMAPSHRENEPEAENSAKGPGASVGTA